jgi:hypothetical protein
MREVQELCRKYYLTHGVWFVDEQFPRQTQKPQISKTSDDNEVVLSYVRGTCLRFAAALRIFGNPCASRVLQGLISRMHTYGPGCIRDTYAAPPLFAQRLLV